MDYTISYVDTVAESKGQFRCVPLSPSPHPGGGNVVIMVCCPLPILRLRYAPLRTGLGTRSGTLRLFMLAVSRGEGQQLHTLRAASEAS